MFRYFVVMALGAVLGTHAGAQPPPAGFVRTGTPRAFVLSSTDEEPPVGFERRLSAVEREVANLRAQVRELQQAAAPRTAAGTPAQPSAWTVTGQPVYSPQPAAVTSRVVSYSYPPPAVTLPASYVQFRPASAGTCHVQNGRLVCPQQ